MHLPIPANRTFADYYTRLNNGEQICPAGWRVPNQTEVILMEYYLTDSPEYGQGNIVGIGACMSRTVWSFGGYAPDFGFYTQAGKAANLGFNLLDNGNMTVDNARTFPVRCVRDVRID